MKPLNDAIMSYVPRESQYIRCT